MPWWRKKKKKDERRRDEDEREEEDSLSTPYRPDMVAPFGLGFEILMRELNRALEQMLNDEELWRGGSRVYGFSVTIGPDGRPVVREFGKGAKPTIKELEDSKVPEVTRNYDVIDLGDRVEVIVELKDAVREGDVRVRGSGDKVMIEAKGMKSLIKLTHKVGSEPEKVIVRNNVVDAIFKKE